MNTGVVKPQAMQWRKRSSQMSLVHTREDQNVVFTKRKRTFPKLVSTGSGHARLVHFNLLPGNQA